MLGVEHRTTRARAMLVSRARVQINLVRESDVQGAREDGCRRVDVESRAREVGLHVHRVGQS